MWLFRVWKISLRIPEYKQGIKWGNCFNYYVKTSSSWCFLFSTTMKSALLCTVITLHYGDFFPKRNIATMASPVPICGKSLFHVVICSFLVSSCDKKCDKKNLKWIFIPYDVLWPCCVLYIPSPEARDMKHTTRFIIHRMDSNENSFEILYLCYMSSLILIYI